MNQLPTKPYTWTYSEYARFPIDRVKKPRRYVDFGVPENWVVDPEEQVVWTWRFAAGKTEAERISDRITWQPPGASEPFVVELSILFRPMWD